MTYLHKYVRERERGGGGEVDFDLDTIEER